MAANQSEGTRSIETKETPEDGSGKKKSKFQAFKKFFVKKKRKEYPAPSTESNLKPSQSSSDVSVSGANRTAFHPTHEPVAKGNMGNKAVSHDSVFISEMENSTKEDISQENTPGKVKALQLQLQQNIRIGSPPQAIVPKKLEDSGTLSEDDGLPRSPPEITSLHEIFAQSPGKSPNSDQRRGSLSLEGTDSEDEPESCELSSRPISPLHPNGLLCPTSSSSQLPLVDFTSLASSVAFLDNSAAKHRIAVKPKKQRRPVMNVKQTKDTAGISRGLHAKEKDEADKKVEHQQLVNIPHSEKRSAEQETPNEQVKCTEDVVVQESEVDITVSLSASEMDASKLSTENFKASLVSETSLLGNQVVSFQNEATCNETDVDFHGNQLYIGDQVDTAEEDTDRGEKITPLPQSCDFQPWHDQNEITAVVEPFEINNAEVQLAQLDISQDLAYGVSEHPITNQQGTSVCGTDDAIENEVEDEDLNVHDKICACLSEVQNDLPEVNALITSETSQDYFKSEPVTAIIKDDEVEEITTFTPECESTHAESPVSTLSEVIPAASDQLVVNVEVDQSIINYLPPLDHKVESSDLRIIESSNKQSFDARNETTAVTQMTDSFSIHMDRGAHGSDVDVLSNMESLTDMGKVPTPTDPNTDSKHKTSTKPVRFTVAPAWQRVLSVGSNVKDNTVCKNMVANTVRSESFDGTDEPVVDNCKNSEKLHEMVKRSKEDSCVPFGVRLRSTSSSIKYSEENPEEFAKQSLSSVETVSFVPAQNVQTPTKTQQVRSDFTKMSKTSNTNEDRNQLKPKEEDLLPREIPEPAWITMAKLKQKGFQDHPLAREQSITTESDKAEATTEWTDKKSIVTSPQELEVKRSELASADVPAASEDARVEPSRNTRSSQQQNPDEPPWFSLAKKKAKAWSEMPQIVQ